MVILHQLISAQPDLTAKMHVLNTQVGRKARVESESHLLKALCIDVVKKRVQKQGSGEGGAS